MNDSLLPLLVASGLVLFMVLGLVTGRWVGLRHQMDGSQATSSGLGLVGNALFALFGLLIAFTFSGASGRYDARRMLIADEANAIGTAYLRIDLLPAASQSSMHSMFRRYVEARLAVYHRLTDLDTAQREFEKAGEIQDEIWTVATAALQEKDALPSAPILVVSALNTMFDMATTRRMAALAHPPSIVFFLLLAAGMLCAFLVGYENADGKARQWVHMVVFIMMSGLTVYVIIEMEYPRLGFIRLDAFDEVLMSVLRAMK
ncbi:MAG: hypothetical protein JSR62_12490 [Nitrospira sp.]|nr:hypothetical protein [Nitrospira sp.]